MKKNLLIIIIIILLLLNFKKAYEKFSNFENNVNNVNYKIDNLENKINNLPILDSGNKEETINKFITESLFQNYKGKFESIKNLGQICKSILNIKNLNIPGNTKVYGKLIIGKDVPEIGQIVNLKNVYSEQNNLLEKLKFQNKYVSQNRYQGINLENNNLYNFYKIFPNQLRLDDYIFITKEEKSDTLNNKFRIGIEKSDSYEREKILLYSYDKENYNKGYYINGSNNEYGPSWKWDSKLPGPYLKNYKVKSIDFNVKDKEKEDYLWTNTFTLSKEDNYNNYQFNPENKYMMISLKPSGSSNYVYFGPIYFDSILSGFKTPIFKWIDYNQNWTGFYRTNMTLNTNVTTANIVELTRETYENFEPISHNNNYATFESIEEEENIIDEIIEEEDFEDDDDNEKISLLNRKIDILENIIKEYPIVKIKNKSINILKNINNELIKKYDDNLKYIRELGSIIKVLYKEDGLLVPGDLNVGEKIDEKYNGNIEFKKINEDVSEIKKLKNGIKKNNTLITKEYENYGATLSQAVRYYKSNNIHKQFTGPNYITIYRILIGDNFYIAMDGTSTNLKWVSSSTIPSRPDRYNNWYGGVHNFVSGNVYSFGSNPINNQGSPQIKNYLIGPNVNKNNYLNLKYWIKVLDSWYGPITIKWVGYYPQGSKVNKFVFN